jgi:hypothetical protein
MTYDDLLDAAKDDPESVDFHTLRMAYTRARSYAPYMQDAGSVKRLREALRDGDAEGALDAVDDLLALNYLDIEAHMAADYVYTKLEAYDQSAYHRAFARGLIQAILATGDGRNYDSAFIVLNVSEEYTVLRVMGLVPTRQRLVEHQRHWFDVVDGRHPESGEMIAVVFNIDLPRAWLRDHLESGPDAGDE